MDIKVIKMWTRSKNLLPTIDFDEASREWMKNKKKLENGTYEYIPKKEHKVNEYIIHKK
jgi:hypothetical protein